MVQLKRKIADILEKGIRFDGRKADEFRKMKVEYGISKTAEGSARVTLGDTIVIAGVKTEIGTPYPDTQDQGNLMVGAELLALSSPDFESGPPSEWAIEVARVVDRGIRESHAIDVHKLVIKKGEQVWTVIADICIINDSGNILDAASVAVLAAIKDAKFPEVDKDGNIDYKHLSKKSIPLDKEPIAVTVFKIHNQLFVDPTDEEEKEADARLTITTLEDGTLVSLQKGGEAPITLEEIGKMVDMSIKHGKALRKAL